MKVLFLDIDGVFNRQGTKERHEQWIGVDKELCKLYLSWLEKHPELQVVLTSTWRLPTAFNVGAEQYLNDNGIFWVDITPNIPEYGRGWEINDWLTKHLNVSHIAILDDIGQMQPLGKYLVQTSEKKGLRPKDLIKLDHLLGYDETPASK